LIILAVVAYAALIAYFAACQRWESEIEAFALHRFGPIATLSNGYQDSFLQWLLYFNPAVHLVEFLGGVAAAALFLSGPPISERWGNAGTLLSLVLALAAHIWLYGLIAPTNGAIGQIASSLYQPLVVLFVFLAAACPSSTVSRILSLPITVALGEASYSIYLLHAFLGGVPRRLFYLGIPPWILWALSICAIFVISRMTYAYFERPAQKMLRRAMGRSKSRAAISS
jgi:peptidoglycan/LPS O-acetylase OafA/YrhL